MSTIRDHFDLTIEENWKVQKHVYSMDSTKGGTFALRGPRFWEPLHVTKTKQTKKHKETKSQPACSDEIMQSAATLLEWKIIMLNEASQKKKDKQTGLTFLYI